MSKNTKANKSFPDGSRRSQTDTRHWYSTGDLTSADEYLDLRIDFRFSIERGRR